MAIIDPTYLNHHSAQIFRFTVQQCEVVRLMASGLHNREIAMQMDLAVGTVRNILSAVFDQIGVSSRAYLATLWAQGQVLPSHERRALPGPRC